MMHDLYANLVYSHRHLLGYFGIDDVLSLHDSWLVSMFNPSSVVTDLEHPLQITLDIEMSIVKSNAIYLVLVSDRSPCPRQNVELNCYCTGTYKWVTDTIYLNNTAL